jgi:hypothetical protein
MGTVSCQQPVAVSYTCHHEESPSKYVDASSGGRQLTSAQSYYINIKCATGLIFWVDVPPPSPTIILFALLNRNPSLFLLLQLDCVFPFPRIYLFNPSTFLYPVAIFSLVFDDNPPPATKLGFPRNRVIFIVFSLKMFNIVSAKFCQWQTK